MFTLTIVRHGETSYNRNGIIQGQTDIPLSDVGLEQARLVAQRLQKESFTHIISSDLSRAKETAEAIVQTNTASSCPLNFDERLRERRFGVYEGKPSRELMEAAKQNSHRSWTEFSPPGGETMKEVHERAVTFFHDLCNELIKANSATANQKKKMGYNDIRSMSSSSRETKGCIKNFMQDKKTEIGDIILPGGVSGSDLDSMTVSNRQNSARGSEEDFIVFQADTVSEISRKSRQSAERNDEASRKSTEETSVQCISGETASQDVERESTISDVLVVSHGGLIKELVKFFVEKLDCEIPGGKGNGLRICHNCSVSKFVVSVPTVDDPSLQPKVTCLSINSKEHLQGMGIEFAEGKY